MSIKNSIPNFVTCCSLISGCIACIMALRGNLPMATLWIVIAAVFDFGDGFACPFPARLLSDGERIGFSF